MNRRVQYAKIVRYLASRGVCNDLPKRYAASLDPDEDYEFEDMTPLELEVYSSVLSQLIEHPHEAMDTAQIYREMMFIDTLLKGASKQVSFAAQWKPNKIIAPLRTKTPYQNILRREYGEPYIKLPNSCEATGCECHEIKQPTAFYYKPWHNEWYSDPENESIGSFVIMGGDAANAHVLSIEEPFCCANDESDDITCKSSECLLCPLHIEHDSGTSFEI